MYIGCDLIKVSRLKKALENPNFINRVFSNLEKTYCTNAQNIDVQITRFAARFAAKEACAKALGVGIGSRFSFQDLQIGDQKTQKEIFLSDRFNQLLQKKQLSQIRVSLSHEKEYAFAVVLLF
jgi:holo-[acyl-carrier protein] synthase